MSERVVDPSDFFSEDPPERIMGSECEYPVNGVFIKIPAIKADVEYVILEPEARMYLQHRIIGKAGQILSYNYIDSNELFSEDDVLDSGDHYLGNGARVYPDQELLEYASAEALGPTQAAAADFAGTKVMQSLVENADLEGSQLFRRVGTGHKNSYNSTGGYHENYLIPGSMENEDSYSKRTALESFLVTRTWAMSGMIGESFKLSQKAQGIGSGISGDRAACTNPGSKPIASFRHATYEPATSGVLWGRFEVRYADANLSRWADYMSFATTSLVLRMIEHYDIMRDDLDEICLKEVVNPPDSYLSSPLHIIAADLTLKKKFETESGQKLTSIDIQEKLALAAKKLSKKIVLPADELAAIDEWLEVCDDTRKTDAKNHDYSLLADRVDWAARHTYISQRAGGHEKLTRDNNFAVAQDLVWDRIVSKGRGQWYWEKHPERQNIVPQEQIDALVYNPPKNTRAAVRSSLIKANKNNIYDVDWSNVVTLGDAGKPNDTTILSDPYAYETEA